MSAAPKPAPAAGVAKPAAAAAVVKKAVAKPAVAKPAAAKPAAAKAPVAKLLPESKKRKPEEEAIANSEDGSVSSSSSSDAGQPHLPKLVKRDMKRLRAMLPPKKINIPLMQLSSGEYCMTPDQWDWAYVGLKAVALDDIQKPATTVRRCKAYWILPSGQEQEPHMFLAGMHSFYGITWNTDNEDYKQATPALGIDSDLQPDSVMEQLLAKGDKWILERLYDLNEFLFTNPKSQEVIRDEYHLHKMLKPGKISVKSGELLRNHFRQKIQLKYTHHPDDVANKVKKKDRRIIHRDIGISITNANNKKINLDTVHQKPCNWDGVSKFQGIVFNPSTKCSTPWDLQSARFHPIKTAEERCVLPSMPQAATGAPAVEEEPPAAEDATMAAAEGEETAPVADDESGDLQGDAVEETADGETPAEDGGEQGEAAQEEEAAVEEEGDAPIPVISSI